MKRYDDFKKILCRRLLGYNWGVDVCDRGMVGGVGGIKFLRGSYL